MSAVETIRDIPVIVEHRKGCQGSFDPMDVDYHPSGFPFDTSGRRTRDPLDDIAQRHPEFAQHLQGFPRRSQRETGDSSNPETDEYLRRRFERPFSSGRFERFGFPFNRADFEREPQRYFEAYPEYFEQQPQSPSQQPQTSPSGYQQHPPKYSQEYQPAPKGKQSPQYQQQESVSQGTQTEDSGTQTDFPLSEEVDAQEVKPEGTQTRGRPIQQSNTCDLAQHQPPDDALNERGQRSMSAPPENQRFTSSVNIPMGMHQENSSQTEGGAKCHAAGSGSTERVIPIHVEGRDVPVVPRNFAGSTTSQPPPQPERIFTDGPRSQSENIFGRRPEAFTQFVHREPHHKFASDWPSFGGFPEDDFPGGFRRCESPSSRFASAKPQQQHRAEAAPSSQVPKPQEKPQEPPKPQQQSPPPPQQPTPPPVKQPSNPIEQIQAIQKDVSNLLRQVSAFTGKPRDKNYLYLDEMLTRNMLKLDDIDTQGQDTIRSARKEAIKCIEKAIGLLEAKAAANVAPPQEENMEVEAATKTEDVPEQVTVAETMEVQNVDESKSGEEEEAAKENVQDEVKSEETPANEQSQESVAEVKEGEKKDKKKAKKKGNKEEKKQ